MQLPSQAEGEKKGGRATLNKKSQCVTHMEFWSVQDDHHYNHTQPNLQMMPRIVVCVYCNCTKRQNVSSFLPKFAGRSQMLEQPALKNAKTSARELPTLQATQRTRIAKTAVLADPAEVDYSTERPSPTVQETSKQTTARRAVGKRAAEGSPVDCKGKSDRHPTSQEVTLMKEHTNPEPSDTAVSQDNTLVSCRKSVRRRICANHCSRYS